MNSKKRVVCFVLLFILAAGLCVTTLVVPMVNIVACDTSQTPVFQGTVNLIEYTKQQIFLQPGVDDMFFNATGPLWLATAGLLFNYLVVLMSGILAFVCLLELITSASTKLITRQNMFAKKLGKFVGIVSLIIYIFQIVCFIVTTMMSEGYASFTSDIQIYLGAGLSLFVLIFACLTGKKQNEQEFRKAKNAMGFLYTALFAGATAGVMFLPVFSDLLPTELQSVFNLTTNWASLGALQAGGDIPIGIIFYALIALGACCAFVFIYSMIGFILSLAGKRANWLSRAVKNWSVLLLIASTIVNVLVLTSVSVLFSAVFVDQFVVFAPLAIVMFVAPYLALFFSNMIAYNKKAKVQE